MQKTRGAVHLTRLLVILGLLVAMQFYGAMLNVTRAAYLGIQFGTEAQVSSDGANDIWQLEKIRYTYIATNQSKPEVDLLGLQVRRNANAPVTFSESQIVNITSSNKQIDYNNSYIFSIPLNALINVSYTFRTNQNYGNSSLELYNWTSNDFYNQSSVMNQSKVLLLQDFYASQKILVHFNITYSQEFWFWYNLTFEFWYRANQVISIQFEALTAENASLVNHLRAWIFLDTNGDNKSNYAIQWLYGNSTNPSNTTLYQIDDESFTLGGAWNGTFGKYWTGMDWRWGGILPQNLGTMDFGNRMVNVTLPDFAVNLTSTVYYAVWAQKSEANYDWWDALPDDPYWALSPLIPGFQWLFLGLGILFIGAIFWGRRIIKGKWI